MSVKFLSISLSALLFIFIIEMVRREKLTFKYAAGWIAAAILGIFFAIYDRILFVLADRLGFALTSNFIFFALLGGFVFLSLMLTIFLCQQNQRNDRIAQKLGILEQEILNRKGRSSNAGQEGS